MSADLVQLVTDLARRARAASLVLATAPTGQKNATLARLAELLPASADMRPDNLNHEGTKGTKKVRQRPKSGDKRPACSSATVRADADVEQEANPNGWPRGRRIQSKSLPRLKHQTATTMTAAAMPARMPTLGSTPSIDRPAPSTSANPSTDQ